MKKPGGKKPARERSPKRKRTRSAESKKGGTSLTGLETEIMQVLWRQGTVTAAEVRQALMPGRPLAHTTILTVLDKLRVKKAVRLMPAVGREKKFRARVEKETVAGELLRNLRGLYFNGSSTSMVARLIRDDDVDGKELEEIRGLIEESKKEGSER